MVIAQADKALSGGMSMKASSGPAGRQAGTPQQSP